MPRRGWRVLLLSVLSLATLLLVVAPAEAALLGGRSGLPILRAETNTQIVLSSLGNGTSVTGFIADESNPFDPVKEGYPPSNPTSGFSPKNESFAGIIHAKPVGGGADMSLYCIDILTLTRIGYGYGLGTWNAANVPNVGYVARLLDEYYPNTGAPASLTNLDEKAAAVQAAIWFFSDRYVLSTSDRLHKAVVEIVEHVRERGPVIEPSPPTLTLAPPHLTGHAGSVVGPFTLTTDAGHAAVTATGGNMYSNAAGTAPIASGESVPSGQRIWVRSTGPQVVVLQASANATVPSGNVYLYSGNSGANEAQKLILASTATLKTTVSATAQFLPAGSLVVRKTIAGPAAGSQGSVAIQVTCDDGVTRPEFVIPEHAPAGTTSMTYGNIPAETACTVIEKSNGSVTGVEVVVTGDGQEVTIPSSGTQTVTITDTYRYIGSLLVRKTIAGPAAGQQGEIRIHSECDGTPLTPDFVIPANAPSGQLTKQYDGIPAPATCTVTETADGHTSTVSVVVQGSGQTVSIPPGTIPEAGLGDTYGLAPGQLEVTKTIAGELAGQQGQVVIHTVCNGTPLTPDLVIPAGATGDHSQIYSEVPTPASCVVTETTNGQTSTVSALVTGDGQTITVPPGGAGAGNITDIYGPAPGSLLVTKTIAGPLAGQQGPVTIHVVCNGSALSPDFVIPAGTPAGTLTDSFDGLAAGARCTITELEDGATATVEANASGNSQQAIIPAGGIASVGVMDVYEHALGGTAAEAARRQPARLEVTKTIAGPAARRHARIAILVACGGPLHNYAFLIPAHTRAGSISRYFPDLPAGSRCTVIETRTGRTAAAHVITGRRSKTVTLPASGTITAHLTDVFSSAAHVTG
jgi:hypothetical protein